MPKLCTNKCEESLNWPPFPDKAMYCMFCNGPLTSKDVQTAILLDEIENKEKILPKPSKSDTDKQPSKSETDEQPSKSETDKQPSKSDTDKQPSKSETDKQPSKSDTDKQPSKSDTDKQPSKSDTDKQPSKSETDKQPSKSDTDKQPSKSDTDKQPSKSDTDKQPSKSDTDKQPSKSETDKQPSKSDTDKPPSKSDTDKQPSKSDTNKQPSKSDTDKQPSKSDTDKQPSKSNTDKQPSKSNTDKQPSKSDTDKQSSKSDTDKPPSKSDTDKQPSKPDTDKQPSKSDTDKQSSKSDTDKPPSKSDTNKQPSKSDTNKQPSKPDTDKQPSKSDTDKQSSKSDTDKPPSKSDTNKQPSKSDTNKQPSKSDTNKQPSKSDTDKQPSKSDTDKQPSKSNTDKQPSKSDTDKQSSKSDTDKPPSKSDTNKQPSKSDTDKQPSKSDTNKQPSKSDTNKQPSKSDTDKQPSKSNTDKQPSKSNTDKQPSKSDTDKQLSKSDTDKPPSKSDTNKLPFKSDTDKQPSKSDTDKQSSKSDTDKQPSKSNTDIQPSKSNTDKQPSKSNTDKQPSKSDTNKQPLNSDSDKNSSNFDCEVSNLPILSEVEPNCPNCLTLHFNTIVLKEVWDRTDAVCLRIGMDHFTGLYCKFHLLKVIHLINNNKEFEFVLITGFLKVPVTLIRDQILQFPYKYFFYMRNDDGVFEDLHHYQRLNFNRHFFRNIPEISTDLMHSIVTKFDMMILPECPNKEDGIFTMNALYSLFSKFRGDQFPFKDIHDRRFLSLLAFLPMFMGMGYFPCPINYTKLDDFFISLTDLVKEFAQFRISPCDDMAHVRFWDDQKDYIDKAPIILIQRFTLSLHLNNDQLTIKERLLRIYLSCYLIFSFKLTSEVIISKVVGAIGSIINESLPIKYFALEYIKQMDQLHEVFCAFIYTYVLPTKFFTKYYQLLAFYHCIFNLHENHVNSLNRLSYTDNEYWGYPAHLSICNTRSISYDDIQRSFDLFPYDSILSYSIIHNSINYFNADLFYQLHLSQPTVLPLSGFISLILIRQSKNNLDRDLFMSIMKFLISKFSQEDFSKSIPPLEIEHLFKLTLKLPSQLSIIEISKEGFFIILELIAHQCTTICTSAVSKIPSEDIQEVFVFIEKWYKQNIYSNKKDIFDLEREMEFWDRVINLQFPHSIEWSNSTTKLLEKRLKKSEEIQLSLFIELLVFVHDKLSDCMKDLFLKEMIAKLKFLDTHKINEVVSRLKSFHHGKLKCISAIFSSILLDERETFVKDQINHLFQWPSWENYFEFVNIPELFKNLSVEAQTILDTALSRFFILIQSLCSYQINLYDASLVSQKQDLFLSLAQLAIKYYSEEKATLQDVKSAIKFGRDATNWLTDQRARFEKLKQFYALIPMVNFSSIEDFLAMDYMNFSLNEIVIIDDDKFLFRKLPYINNIINFPHFLTISESLYFFKDSAIFIHSFSNLYQTSDVCNERVLNFELLYNQVWTPTLNIISKIIESTVHQTILLSDVQNYFGKKQDNLSIFNELKFLYSGFLQSQSKPIVECPELPECSEKIALYFNIYKNSEAALKLIKLRDAFSIEGDFSLIENLQNVKMKFQNKTLSAIDDELFNTTESLRHFTYENLEVLERLLSTIEFLKWVKRNMHDLNDLKTFVEIALTTSSGDGAETDRIMILHSVCTNLAPIIFPINRDTTYDYLIERCIEVFSVVNTNKELITMLEYVSKNVSFWEELKKSQGSLEEGALMQLEKIVSSGNFTISTHSTFNAAEMVSLSTGKKGTVTKSYAMEQLKDLRSKLTLVVGKSDIISKIDSKQNASKFNQLFDLISELATIVSSLAEIGNMRFFNYSFSCDLQQAPKVESEIQKTRDTLIQCEQRLEEARTNCYFLNFFTIKQIVLLQKGVRAFIENSDPQSEEQLYHLLSSLNADITREEIQLALKQSDIVTSTQLSHSHPTAAPSRQTRFHSTAHNSQYSFIGAETVKKPAKPLQQVQESKEVEIPDSFSHSEREIVEKLCSYCGFSLSLCIQGINTIRRQTEVVTEQSVMRWCMQNNTKDDERDSSSGDESMDFDDTEERSDTALSTHTPVQITEEIVTTEIEYIDILKLGGFLEVVYNSGNSKIRGDRAFCTIFKPQEPNLIFIPNDIIYESILSLYQLSPKLPLPDSSEVLLCSDLTTVEEIDIFWRRVIFKSNNNHFYLYCLVAVENLQYEVAVQSVSILKRYLQLEAKSRYKLVIICSEEREEQSYMAAALENYKRPSHVTNVNVIKSISEYLQQKFYQKISYSSGASAWIVDKERSRVRLVVSDSVGAGKSLYINNLKSDLLSQGIVSEEEGEQSAVTVAIHGKQASEEHLAEQLLTRSVSGVKHGVMYHVDIASTVQIGIEPVIFKLLILGGICKRSGELWHLNGKDYYIIETTIFPKFKQLLKFSQLFPPLQCIQPIQALNTPNISESRGMQTININELNKEEFRRTFAYLKQLEAGQDLDKFTFDSTTFHRRSPPEMLQVLLKYCGIQQPSWLEIHNFGTFLSKQLSDCDTSDFCTSGIMGEEWLGFKSFVVKFLIHMSRDFATPSLREEVDTVTKDLIQVYEIVKRRKWENASHPYIFFNPDRHSMTFLGFHISKQGHLYDSEDPSEDPVIEANILQPKLLNILELNRVNLNEDYQQLDKGRKIEKLGNVMELEWLSDPDPGYVLTLDNMRKILAILMRFRCNIPVVIMGETGCGKTRLIQFMCSLQALQTGATNMLILKVHGGTTETDVMRKVEEAENLAQKNYIEHQVDTVLFFDEANTSPAIGLIKEIMCDRRMYGRHIRTDIGLQFIAACNPYRKHTEKMLNKLSSAGLGFFTKSSETSDRLGDIPLRELVYRVMELPASLRPLVWDFGQLSNSIEKTYTREIVAKHLRDPKSPIEARGDIIDVISDVLAGAQSYMRERKDECSFVSLRDVERAMRVMLWFYAKLEFIVPKSFEEAKPSNPVVVDDTLTVQGALTSNVIVKNTPYLEMLTSYSRRESPTSSPTSSPPRYRVPSTHSSPTSPLRISSRLKPPIAHAQPITPLSELPTMSPQLPRVPRISGIDIISYSLLLAIAVCYRARLQVRRGFDERISKHFKNPLTPITNYEVIDIEIDRCQQNILDQMTVGEHIAKNTALKENVFMMFVSIELKIPLFVVGKPGSSKSLAKTIISNNMQGNKCQDGSILRNFKEIHIMSYQCSQLSTAEGIIGVFNNCKKMQKKTQSSKFVCCVVLDEVGLAEDSPLLPLKVLHPLLEDSSYGSEEKRDENTEEVAFIGISNWSLDPAKMNRGIMVSRGDPDKEELLSSAREICRSNTVDSSIVESIEICIPDLSKAYLKLIHKTHKSREYYGLRDFYSLIKMLVFLCNEYRTTLTLPILKHCVYRNFGGASNNQRLQLFLQTVKLPMECTVGPDSSPLGLIRANLASFSTSFYGETRYLLLLTENYSALNILLKSSNLWPENKLDDIRVIFGSNFPRDQEYSTVCRNINKIKVCMESGKTVILLNLENLYESLYDALNQYYMKIYNQRYVDLGLGTHRMKCRVHNNFKLIVIADSNTVYSTFPTPLINRLEKHFLTMSTVLTEDGVIVSEQLAEWAQNFSTLDRAQSIGLQRRGEFTIGDCFIGYNTDTPSSIVFNVMKEMYPHTTHSDVEVDKIAVLERSQTLLLRMATTDAVLRVKNSHLSIQSEQIIAEYFKLQLGSLEEYLSQVLSGIFGNETGAHLTLATTHSRLLTERDIDQLQQRLSTDTDSVQIRSLSLQQFQTEQQYIKEIRKFLRGDSESETREKKVLLVQCERGAENTKLIACARHKTVDELKDWREEQRTDFKCDVFLLFLVQLSREVHGSKFMSFCGGDWNTVHIDDIRSLNYTELPPISHLIGRKIYQIFGGYEQESGEIIPPTICQKTRLLNCIQSAVSRLVDMDGSEKRTLVRMQDFIKLVEGQNDNHVFFKTLCQRLTVLLKDQYESSVISSCDWLLQTANCGEDIQTCGTFRKAVNLRINNTITPLLSELIACLDKNGNLELALHNEEMPECLYNLWQDIFRDERLFVLQYKDTVSHLTLLPRRRVPVLSDGAGGKYFESKFPFSFLIRTLMEELWRKFATIKPNTSGPVWYHFESLFNQTPLGELINRNFMSNDTYFNCLLEFLMDFIQMNILTSRQLQFNVYESVLLLCIEYFPTYEVDDGERSETCLKRILTIPKIYCAYEESKQLLDLLQEAFLLESSLEDKIFKIIKEMRKIKDIQLTCLELVLLEEIIALCYHKKERTAREELAEKYVTEIRQWQPIVEKGLSFNRRDDHEYKTTVDELKSKWNRIIAVQLFVSHCTLSVGLSCTESSINRLFMILTETPDFTSVQTIKDILDILSDCLKNLPGGQRSEITRKQKMRECATRFFINILTSLTFKCLPKAHSSADLIELLVGLVMLDENNMKELERNERSSITMFKKNGLNPSLSFKTFLLQIMIKHRRDVFTEIISHYLSRTLPGLENLQTNQELYMIIIQSIEDSHHQHFKQQKSDEQHSLLEKLLRNEKISSTGIHGISKRSILSYELLEKIATLRFICIHISHWIIECCDLLRTGSETPDHILRERQRLIFIFKDICLMQGYEDLHVFLLKNVYHQLGSDTLRLITSNRTCSWVIPKQVKERMVESQYVSPDYFIIYGDSYAKLKYSAEQVNVSQRKESLLQYFDSDVVGPQEKDTNVEYYLYSIFEVVSKSATRRDVSQTEKYLALRELLNTNLSNIQTELLQIGLQMLSNNLGNGTLQSLHFSPHSNNNQLALSRAIYHMAIMLSTNAFPQMFSPISLLYQNPNALVNKLFPTMMDDQLHSVRQVVQQKEGRGQWYLCNKGHAYFVGECGQPTQAQICPDCGAWVGGKDGRVTQVGTLLNTTADVTKSGYVLGRVDQRQNIPSSERSLSPASVSLIRILMDISFIWSSCSKHSTDRSQVLPSLVKGGLEDPRDLPTFFYQHLEKDIRDLAGLIGKNFEEATFLLHLVIKSLMQTAGEPCGIPTELTQRELREQWEKEFDKKFIQPILTSLHTDVQRQMQQVLSEKRIANNPLLRIVYEREEPEPDNPFPHLWRYRTIVSLDHFSQSFSTADLITKEKCPLVSKLLKEESRLFVTRYLPDIVQLQRRVGDRFLHRLDRRDAANTTIKQFLAQMRRENQEEAERITRLVESLSTAWSLIGDEVKRNGRLRMEDALEQQITPATSLAYLLASSTGEGVLITSLTDYLVLVHNSFVHAYRDRVKGSRSDKVPLRELKGRHVIEYEEQLQPLLLSHAHYSLALGQGSLVSYDFEGVEKQLMEQLFQNRPLIMAEHLRFEYTREAYNLGVFDQVRHKVQQTELKEMLWRAIREDLDSLESVSDVLLVLDVVIGFLSSAGGDPEQRVSFYLHEVLRYPHGTQGAGPLQSRRAEGVLSLKHILSFWSLLSVEKARKLSILGQIPFSSLRDEFRESVSEEERRQIEQSCDHFPVEKVLVYLHEFILFFVRERGDEEKDYGLKESINEYADEKEWKLSAGFSSNFPEGIKLSQCAAAWAVLAKQEHRISNNIHIQIDH